MWRNLLDIHSRFFNKLQAVELWFEFLLQAIIINLKKKSKVRTIYITIHEVYTIPLRVVER